jgi:predicted translin family RNA/ssDNA-binding protein
MLQFDKHLLGPADVQKLSKQAIFSLHRNDGEGAKNKINEAGVRR